MIAAVSNDTAQLPCRLCGAVVWHVMLNCDGAILPRAEEHSAQCGKPCANGVTDGHGHKKLAMDEMHFDGCAVCVKLARAESPVAALFPFWPFGSRR